MKKIFMLLIILSTSVSAQKKILMMVSQGFYAPEYYIPLKAFKEAGFEVKTAAKYMIDIEPDRRQIGKYSSVRPDLTFDQINEKDFDAIVFAGGNGAWEDFFPNKDVHIALTSFYKSNKITALLCSATGLLGVANNLDGQGEPIAQGKRVTGYKRVKGLLIELGKTQYSSGTQGKPYVVVDGNLITGRDPISSEAFSKAVIKALK